MSEMQEMMVDQLRDAISAEKQAIQGMRRMQRKTTDQQLRAGIEAHVAQSESQAERVQQVLEMIGGGKGRKVCQGMRGLVEEAQEELGEHDKGPVLDLVIVAALQRRRALRDRRLWHDGRARRVARPERGGAKCLRRSSRRRRRRICG